MIKNPGFTVICILFLSLFSSCSKNDDADTSFSFINLEFYEQFTPAGRELVFFMETVEEFPCSNFFIKTNVHDTQNSLQINTESLDISDICVAEIGPATTKITLGVPENYSKKITIWVNDKQHDFHFNITDESMQVEKHSKFQNHLIFKRDLLNRLPPDFVWGYIVDQGKSDEGILDTLLQVFYRAGAEEYLLSDGQYYYFKVADGKIIFSDDESGISGFGFSYDNSLDKLAELSQETAPGLQIRLFDTRGSRIVN